MSKIKEFETCYLSEPACEKCDWFSVPLLDFSCGPPVPRTTCPECGSCTAITTGKYKVREEYVFFGLILKSREYLSFERAK